MAAGVKALVVAALVVAALAVAPAGASAAAPLRHVVELREGTAILAYEGAAVRRQELTARLVDAGVRVARHFDGLRMVAVRGAAAQLRAAARLPVVTAAQPNYRLRFHTYQSSPLVYRGSETRQQLFSQGYNGAGVTVAVVDSGVFGAHPDLEKRIVHNVKFENATGTAIPCQPQPRCQTDTSSGHGTHVAGTVVGDGTGSGGFFQGVAPGASLVGLGVGDSAAVLQALAAYEYILDNPQLDIRVVNNSFGPVGDDNRFDSTEPLNKAAKQLNDERGVLFVWSAGNSGPNDPPSGTKPDNPGASDCSTREAENGEREPTEGACKINPYSVAPWAVSVAAGRKADPNTVQTVGGPGDQTLAFFSSRGDFRPQTALSGETINYIPTLTAPGVNIRSTRNPSGDNNAAGAISAEPPAARPPRDSPQDEALYFPLSGTSMSAPHVAGAAAVVQSAAKARLGRLLTPAELKKLLAESAAPMPARDLLWDWPCGSNDAIFVDCGERATSGQTGQPYQAWQVGTGYLDIPALIGRLDTLVQVPPPAPAACGDAQDNDADGKVDFPNDPGCTGPVDADEADPPPVPAPVRARCSDGVDNDGDGKVDGGDPGCAAAADDDETDGTVPRPAGCLPAALRVTSRGLGPFRIGDTRAQAARRSGLRGSRNKYSLRYCVAAGGRVSIVFARRGDGEAIFIASTAPGHVGARGLSAGDPVAAVRRAYRGARSLGRGLLTVRRQRPLLIGVRAGRVSFLGIADPSVLRARQTVPRILTRGSL